MSNFQNLKNEISRAIRENGNQEITGDLLQEKLLEMVDSLGKDYKFRGVATPDGEPITDDTNVFYVANTVGTYPNYGGLSVADGEIAFFCYNGSWSKAALEDVARKSDLLSLHGENRCTVNDANFYIDENGNTIDSDNIYTEVFQIKANTYIELENQCNLEKSNSVISFSSDGEHWELIYSPYTKYLIYKYYYIPPKDGWIAVSTTKGTERYLYISETINYNIERRSLYYARGKVYGAPKSDKSVIIKVQKSNNCIRNIPLNCTYNIFGFKNGFLNVVDIKNTLLEESIFIDNNLISNYDSLFYTFYNDDGLSEDDINKITVFKNDDDTNIKQISNICFLEKTPNSYMSIDGVIHDSTKHHSEIIAVNENDIVRITAAVDSDLNPFMYSADGINYIPVGSKGYSGTILEYTYKVVNDGFLFINTNSSKMPNDLYAKLSINKHYTELKVYKDVQVFYSKLGTDNYMFGFGVNSKRATVKKIPYNSNSILLVSRMVNSENIIINGVYGWEDEKPTSKINFTSQIANEEFNKITFSANSNYDFITIVLAKETDTDFTVKDVSNLIITQYNTNSPLQYSIEESVAEFMKIVDKKCQIYGMTNSLYKNPYGGSIYGYNETTARDLLKLAVIAANVYPINEIWSTKSAPVEVLGINARTTIISHVGYDGMEDVYQSLHPNTENPYIILGCKTGGWTPTSEGKRAFSMCGIFLIKELNITVAVVTSVLNTEVSGTVGRLNMKKSTYEVLDICLKKLKDKEDVSSITLSYGDTAIACVLPNQFSVEILNNLDIIYEYNADLKINPGSVSKIISALTFIDIISNMEEYNTISSDSNELKNDSDYYAQAGDIESVRSSLYASILASNAANTLMLARVCGERILKEKSKYGLEL